MGQINKCLDVIIPVQTGQETINENLPKKKQNLERPDDEFVKGV